MPTTKTTDPTEQDHAFWEALRAPFPKDQIEIKPQPYQKGAQKGRCDVCNGWHGLPAVHLDYVGHAGLTMRLNEVAGPAGWNWEPMALSPLGTPLISDGCLWIKLTIQAPSGGWVTKIGVGDAEGKSGPSAMKEMIGDALRNAGMRFGMATYLWSKSDAAAALLARGSAEHQVGGEDTAPAPAQARQRAAQPRNEARPAGRSPMNDPNRDPERRRQEWIKNQKVLLDNLTGEQSEWFWDNLEAEDIAPDPEQVKPDQANRYASLLAQARSFSAADEGERAHVQGHDPADDADQHGWDQQGVDDPRWGGQD